MRKYTVLYKSIFIFIASLLFVCCSCAPADTGVSASMDIYVFSCGKADSILVQFDDYNILIDAAENGDGEDIVKELASLNVHKIDLMILTHHDKDHIGGADTVLENIPVSVVRMPAYESDSKQYTQLISALEKTNTELILMNQDSSFSIGTADFTIWASTIPYNGKNDNEQSLVTKILYNGKSLLFMGDAEESWLKELCFSGRNLTCDVMKLPHHGVYDSNLIALFAVTMPEYVFITDSVKNPAEDETLSLLNTFECNVFRTALGTIHFSMRNSSMSVSQ